MYLIDPTCEFFYFIIQVYFEAIHLKMKRNPNRCCFVFEILVFLNTGVSIQKHQKKKKKKNECKIH